MLGKTFFLKINLKYYFFPPKPKEDLLIARDILYAPTVKSEDQPKNAQFPGSPEHRQEEPTVELWLNIRTAPIQ
jgi:hypothetical protein